MATATKWVLDPMHSEVQFKVKHLVISTVSGFFKSFEGELDTENDDFTDAKISFSLNINSIDTNQSQRDEHLKSAEFFDAEKYPTIKFTSTSITKTASGYSAAGTLDMHGVQKPVTIPFTFDNNEFKASFEVNRMDYNVNTAEPNHGGQKFKVDIDVPVTK